MNAKNELYLRSYNIYLVLQSYYKWINNNLLNPSTVSSPLSKNAYTAVNNPINNQNIRYCICYSI